MYRENMKKDLSELLVFLKAFLREHFELLIESVLSLQRNGAVVFRLWNNGECCHPGDVPACAHHRSRGTEVLFVVRVLFPTLLLVVRSFP